MVLTLVIATKKPGLGVLTFREKHQIRAEKFVKYIFKYYRLRMINTFIE